MRLITLFFSALLFVSPAIADDDDEIYNRVHLSADASTDIENDQLVAELYAQEQASTAAAAASSVNEAINWGVTTAKAVEGIKVRTLEYRTQPVYQKNRIDGWRASQAIRLESKDAEKLGKLISQLQEKLALRNLGYEVSKEKREAVTSSLIDDAIAAFRTRAMQVAKAFGHDEFKLVQVNINTGHHRPPVPVFRGAMAEMASADAMPAAIEAGTSTLNVSVSGTIELR